MKKTGVILCVLVSWLAIGASVWEGTAAIAPTGTLPEGGYFAATNSFPKNTVVDITNIENNLTIRVVVASGLDSPGLLAVLSRNAAKAIGLADRGVGRIRMVQAADVSQDTGTKSAAPGGTSSPLPSMQDTPPLAGNNANNTSRVQPSLSASPEDVFFDQTVDDPHAFQPSAATGGDGSIYPEPKPVWVGGSQGIAGTPKSEAAPVSGSQAGQASAAGSVIAVVPAGPKPPTAPTAALPADAEIAPIGAVPKARSPKAYRRRTMERTEHFSIPVIKKLEKGRYYVQLGAYDKALALESAVSRVSKVGRSYPLKVNPQGSKKAMYRLLIGPLNQGEAAAIVERFRRAGWKDAFVRSGR
jgi:hypothetical protein